jgi:hypothetical protein
MSRPAVCSCELRCKWPLLFEGFVMSFRMPVVVVQPVAARWWLFVTVGHGGSRLH